MSKYNELRALIDQQNIDILMTFIAANPELNYSRISPNGASALWWALMPPRGVSISVELVQGLLNYIKDDGNFLCNPTQAFANFARPIDYIKIVDYLSELSAIRDALRAAENRYVAPVVVQRGLADFALDRQSSHNSLITPIVHANITRLYSHYVEDKSRALDAELCARSQTEIGVFIDEGFSCVEEKREQIKQGLDFCYSNTSVFAVRDASIKEHPEWALNLAQLLSLNWLAANERDGRLLPYSVGESESNDSESGLVSRRKAVLDNLFDIATAYGEGGVSCAAGAFARFGLSLAEQHALVHGSDRGQRLTGLEARRAITQTLSAALKRLPEARYMAVIRYVAITTPNLDDEKEYTSFIQWVQPSLGAELTAMNVDPQEIESSLAVIEDGVYPLAGDTRSFMLQELLHFFEKSSLSLALFYQAIPVASLINEAITVISATLTQNASFTAWLERSNIRVADNERGALVTYFINEWLRDIRLQDAPFPLSTCVNPLSAMYTDCDVLKSSFKVFVQPLLFAAQFAVKKPELIERNPIQEPWLNSLAHQDIIALMGAAYAKDNKIFMDFTGEAIKAMVLEALQQGVTAHLSLEKLCFKNKDLRAFDFTNTNLNGVSFERCQLPVAGLNLTCTDVQLRDCSIPNDPNPNGGSARLFSFFKGYYPYIKPGLMLQFFIQNADAVFFKLVNIIDQMTLTVAARCGDTIYLKLFLGHQHCSVDAFNAQDENGHSAIMLAAASGQTACLEMLLAHKHCSADAFKAKNSSGDNALMTATSFGQTECLQLLLAHEHCSADVFNARNKNGNNLLMLAMVSKHAECLQLLLAHKYCSVNASNGQTKNGGILLMVATGLGRAECLQLLLAHNYCSVNAFNRKDRNGNSLLILATGFGQTECLQLLLAHEHCSADVFNVQESNGRSAIMIATGLGHTVCLEMLLAHKHCLIESFNTRNNFGENALMIAAKERHIACLAVLLAHEHCSVDAFNAQDENGYNAVMIASSKGYTACLEALLTHEYCSVDVFSTRNNFGENALMIAAKERHTACLAVLLAHKRCSIEAFNARSHLGENALMIAAGEGQTACLAVLLAHKRCSVEAFNAQDKNGRSAIMLAAQQGQTECLQLLLAHKHCSVNDFNAQDKYGCSLLIIAVVFGHKECLQLLLSHKYCSVNVFNARDKFDQTALMVAAGQGQTECLAVLLAYKYCSIIGVNARYKDSISALKLANYLDSKECFSLLPTHNFPQKHTTIIKASSGSTLKLAIKNNYGIISMTLSGVFALALGVSAVVIAFTVLNAVALSITGVALACAGMGVALTGIGIFSASCYKGLHKKAESYECNLVSTKRV